MKIGKAEVKIFKIKNRKGYAATCGRCLTEGSTIQQAYARMVKAIRRTTKKNAS
jgi:predicted nucleic-acid-binding Zn-ribbon protein